MSEFLSAPALNPQMMIEDTSTMSREELAEHVRKMRTYLAHMQHNYYSREALAFIEGACAAAEDMDDVPQVLHERGITRDELYRLFVTEGWSTDIGEWEQNELLDGMEEYEDDGD